MVQQCPLQLGLGSLLWTPRRTERQAERQGSKAEGRQEGREAGREGRREAGREGGREAGREGGREAERKAGREAGRAAGAYPLGRSQAGKWAEVGPAARQTHSQGATEPPSSPPPQRSPALRTPPPRNRRAILGPACAASLPRCPESREQGADQRLYPWHLPPCAPRQGVHVLKPHACPHACTHTCTLTYMRTHGPPEQHVQRRLCPLGVKLPGNRRKAAPSLSRETPLREKSSEKL